MPPDRRGSCLLELFIFIIILVLLAMAAPAILSSHGGQPGTLDPILNHQGPNR